MDPKSQKVSHNNDLIVIEEDPPLKERLVPQYESQQENECFDDIYESFSSTKEKISKNERDCSSPLERAKKAIEEGKYLLNSRNFFGNIIDEETENFQSRTSIEEFLSISDEKQRISKIVAKTKNKVKTNQQPQESYNNNSTSDLSSLMIDPTTGQVQHIVKNNETLEGIAIKYGVTVAELIKANNLWSRNAIYCKKTLTIPVSKEKYLMLIEQQKHQLKRIQRNQQKMIKQFVKETQCDPDVASYYLEESHFDYNKAKERYFLALDMTMQNASQIHYNNTNINNNNNSNNNEKKVIVSTKYNDSINYFDKKKLEEEYDSIFDL